MAEPEDGAISVPEAAERLGVSERTIRRRIKGGAIRATSVDTPQGHTWRIDPATLSDDPALPPGTQDRHPADATRHENNASRHVPKATQQDEDATRQAAATPPGAPGTVPEIVLVLLDELREEYRDRIAELEHKNERNLAAAAHWQARAQSLEERVKQLEAPKDEPALDPEPTPEPVQPERRPWWRRWWSS